MGDILVIAYLIIPVTLHFEGSSTASNTYSNFDPPLPPPLAKKQSMQCTPDGGGSASRPWISLWNYIPPGIRLETPSESWQPTLTPTPTAHTHPPRKPSQEKSLLSFKNTEIKFCNIFTSWCTISWKDTSPSWLPRGNIHLYPQLQPLLILWKNFGASRRGRAGDFEGALCKLL